MLPLRPEQLAKSSSQVKKGILTRNLFISAIQGLLRSSRKFRAIRSNHNLLEELVKE